MTHENTPLTSFRDVLGEKPAVFVYELRSQPDESLNKRIPYLGVRNQGVVALSKKDDVILLNTAVDERYLNWLDSVGFERGRVRRIGASPETLLTEAVQDLPEDYFSLSLPDDYVVVPRIATDDVHAAAAYMKKPLFGPSADVMMQYYDKASFKDICSSLGLPVVPYQIVSSDDMANEQVIRDSLASIVNNSQKGLVKQLTASAGAGSFSLDKQSLDNAVQRLMGGGYKDGFLVENLVNLKEEYGAQWAIDTYGQSHHLGTSIMHVGNNNNHKGNSYSPSDVSQDVIATARALTTHMANNGYSGNTQIDLLRDRDGQLYFSENNTRISGSSFAWEIYDSLQKESGHKQFLSSRFRVDKPCFFAELQEQIPSLLYNGQKGFFPYDVGALPITGTFFGLVTGDDYDEIAGQINALNARGIHSDVQTTTEGYK